MIEYINSTIDLLERFWALLVLVAGGIGAYYKWRDTRKKSTEMLFDELEKLKQKIVLQISKELESSKTIAKQELLLNQLKEHCPDCYEKATTLLKKTTNE